MNRRATLATLLGRSSTHTKATEQPSAPRTLLSDLSPFSGSWGYTEAAHLLRRATFGVNNEQVKQAVTDGLDAVVEQLLADLPMPEPPVNYFFNDDPNVPIGTTWVDKPFSRAVNFIPYRFNSLYAWTMGLLLEEGISVREKMTLFWHNHFVTENINDPKYTYNYISLLRENALGNFQELTKEVTINPSMLRYLNGNQNTRRAPNENYARELLELFTIGKGELAGPGDYTTFTETDVIEIAKVLTGWVDVGYLSADPNQQPGAFYLINRHDLEQKQLSHRFGNTTILNAGNREYINLINIIFQQEEVARFICRKLYRWFVYYDIPEEVELNVIEPLAQILRDNNYEIKPVLRALFKSDHFYQPGCLGCMIKNPLDFMVNILKQMKVDFPSALFQKYNAYSALFGYSQNLQMLYYFPPNVAGWKAYYQEPLYYQTWISSSTLSSRVRYTDIISTRGAVIGNYRLRLDVLTFINELDNPYDIDELLRETTRLLLPQGVTDEQNEYLREILIPGLPNFEWKVEYTYYRENPLDVDAKNSIEAKLRRLIQAILTLAEFHLG
ncbi:MAG: DUF1800 domain-containing protein [Bacteroidota bacterium]